MKKYFIGILALVLAVGFSAFTKPHTAKFTDTKVFEFNGTDAYQVESSMENEANWIYIGTTSQVSLCDNASEVKACRIVIDQAQLDPSVTLVQNSTTLDDASVNLNVDANQIQSPYYRVLSVDKSTYHGTVSNQAVE